MGGGGGGGGGGGRALTWHGISISKKKKGALMATQIPNDEAQNLVYLLQKLWDEYITSEEG